MNLTNTIKPPVVQGLTKSSLEVIARLTELIRVEREAYETSFSVTLRNGEVLNLEEQLACFEKVYEEAVPIGACGLVEIFKDFYQLKQYYNAWSILLANREWLHLSRILFIEEMPENINVAINYFIDTDVISTIERADDNMDFVGFHGNGLVNETINQEGDYTTLSNYFMDGNLNYEIKSNE